ncbi:MULTISPECIES: hypothetical protein [unclassified Mesorhizobium]|uniref:hypothetical protein n=1 Tax=unclassified Mesorhizobium TaxID=325217 RepID=UPI000BAF2DED|nr:MULTISPECIES: hypothetical protein [unclassified Mesorhizobium]PBB39576.1 hypothetical protein CK221_01775 [Mesorhizobium sp. WSM3868]TGQ19367.1 hypothetical protein EN860_019775 [Mesorhizobium sp. M00.F.Ca.ET.217.01.1.1]TGV89070.1 hypothetical protein EN801_021310 [Mesorhizobium sp. M00.F.Ca.ET.158.01.1.1]
MPTPTTFLDSPLLTPERIAADPEAAFAVRPSWVRGLVLVHPDADPERPSEATPQGVSPAAVVSLGESHLAHKTYSLTGLALLFELSRLPGVSVVTNSDGKGRHYERVTIADAAEDLTSVNRLLIGATTYDQAKVVGIKSDMRPENLRATPARKLGKDARAVLLGHAERIVRAWEAKGTMPHLLTADGYLANLERLLALTDLEASGLDPLAALPVVSEEA